eukprot:868-Heterococcus_DN1.PRE.2
MLVVHVGYSSACMLVTQQATISSSEKLTDLVHIASSVVEDSQHWDNAVAAAIAATDVAVDCVSTICSQYNRMRWRPIDN